MSALRGNRFVFGTTVATGALILAVLVTSSIATAATPSTVTTWIAKRSCAQVKSGHAACFAMQLVAEQVPAGHARGAHTRRTSSTLPNYLVGQAGGYTPADLAIAYGVNANASTSAVVAIVDAFKDPDVLTELNAFDVHYGISTETSSSFKVYNQSGGTSLAAVPANTSWAAEIALDVQAVRGICHTCKIVLVEANSNSFDNLSIAVNTAATTLNADIVSNSYGATEASGELNNTVIGRYNHPYVAILASTGDDGWYGWDQINPTSATTGDQRSQVPSSMNTVIGVGGTSLYLNANATRMREDVWNENGPSDAFGWLSGQKLGASGGGCSTTFSAPGWQSSVNDYPSMGCASGKRSAVDIAAIADPYTGYDIYRTYGVADKWYTYGGTSLASPVVAALWALAGGPGNVKYPALSLYGHWKSEFTQHLFDVTFGANGFCSTASLTSCSNSSYGGTANANPNMRGHGLVDCAWNTSSATPLANHYQCYGRPGFDGPSGVGAPIGTTAFTPMFPKVVIKAPTTVTHGTVASFSTTGSSDPFPGGTLVKYVWNWGDGHVDVINGVGSAKHKYAAADPSQTVILYITDSYGQVGRSQITITVH